MYRVRVSVRDRVRYRVRIMVWCIVLWLGLALEGYC